MFEECLSAVIVPVSEFLTLIQALSGNTVHLWIRGCKEHVHVCTFPVKRYNVGISLLGKSLTGCCSRVYSVVAISEHFSLTETCISEILKEQFSKK